MIQRFSGKVGMITLNKPKALNAINLNMVKLITDNMVQWRSDDNVEVLISWFTSVNIHVLTYLFYKSVFTY